MKWRDFKQGQTECRLCFICIETLRVQRIGLWFVLAPNRTDFFAYYSISDWLCVPSASSPIGIIGRKRKS